MENIRIILYEDQYREDFISLNKEWINTYFYLEDSDIKALNNIEDYIINQGGQIFLALLDNIVVGCCALVNHADTGGYELAKMAVTPRAQGMGLGRKLGEMLIDYARKKGIKTIFLEGNTLMVASIALYQRLGFHEIPITKASYNRCNIMMQLDL